MFGFLRKKLKNVVSQISHEVEETVDEPQEEEQPLEEQVEQEKTEQQEKSPSQKKPVSKKKKSSTKKKTTKTSPETQEEKQPEESEPEETETEKDEQSIEQSSEEESPEPVKKKKGFFGGLFSKKETPQEISEETREETSSEEQPVSEAEPEPEPEKKEQSKEETEPVVEPKELKESAIEKRENEPAEQEPEEKKGLFKKVKTAFTTKTLSEEKFEEIFMELEMAMLENNVALEVIDKIKEDLRSELVDQRLPKGKIEEKILLSLKSSLDDLFSDAQGTGLLERIRAKGEKPYVICFIGVNGSGKTTAVAKVAHLLLEEGLKPVMAAADTFRAAAIQQLEEHANRLNVTLIKHDYGSDPAAVAYDAIEHAKAKDRDVVLIDTSGRLHSNVNLMNELHKIERVAQPDLTIFVGESITGNDCVEQAKTFNEKVGFDGIILTKADIDEKGGAFISVSYVTKKPIIYVGTGQEYKDLKAFAKDDVLAQIGL